MKKALSLILALVMCLSLCACQKNSSGGTKADSNPKNFVYEDVNGGVKITQYTGNSDVVLVPSVIDNKKVISLGSTVFSGNVVLKEVTLPDTISTISVGLFKNCEALEKIVYSGNITEIVEGTEESKLSTMPSFQTLEIRAIDESKLVYIADLIRYSDSLDNIVIHEVTNFNNRGYSVGIDYSALSFVDREISVTIPEDVYSAYLKQPAYARNDEIKDPLHSDNRYKLTSVLLDGEDLQPPETFKNAIVKKFLEYGIIVATNELRVVDVEYQGIFVEAKAKYNGTEGVVVAAVGYNEDVYYAEELYPNLDFYEPIDDTAKMCIVFQVNKVTVNGVTYQLENTAELN